MKRYKSNRKFNNIVADTKLHAVYFTLTTYWVFSHDKMITVFLVIIAAAELQGHKPWRENAGQVVYIFI